MNTTPRKIDLADLEAAFAAAVKEDNLCNLGRLLDSCESDVRTVLETKVSDELHYSAATIARVLKGLGFPPVSPETISKHRKSACRCM